jgi:general transcription factor 3C polypeptide 3 (transcription factor C subunit 4)
MLRSWTYPANNLSACAVLVGDEKTCVTIARYFMKEHQFTTDSYRIFTAMVRMSNSPILFFPNDTTRKFIQRQIKLMDDALFEKQRCDGSFGQDEPNGIKGKYDHRAIDSEMDIALLMLYGHVLFANQSQLLAISKCLLFPIMSLLHH